MPSDKRAKFMVISNSNFEKNKSPITEPLLPEFSGDNFGDAEHIKTDTSSLHKLKIVEKEKEHTESLSSPPANSDASLSYHTNPIYEKLLQFELEQKRKKFTVDDLLKW